jgi:NTE family protein
VKELTSYGCTTRMHVVQLLAPRLSHENGPKDVESVGDKTSVGGWFRVHKAYVGEKAVAGGI